MFLMRNLPKNLELLTPEEHSDPKRCFSKQNIFVKLQFSAFKQLVLSKTNNKTQSEGGISSHLPRASLLQRGPLLRQGVGTIGPE